MMMMMMMRALASLDHDHGGENFLIRRLWKGLGGVGYLDDIAPVAKYSLSILIFITKTFNTTSSKEGSHEYVCPYVRRFRLFISEEKQKDLFMETAYASSKEEVGRIFTAH